MWEWREPTFSYPVEKRSSAFGGDLPYDVIFVVRYNGVVSSMDEVRYLVRPDRDIPVSTTNIRDNCSGTLAAARP